MRAFRPTDNPITQGYSFSHRGYDFSGLNRPDEVRSAADGEIVERVDEHEGNWRNTGVLTIRDYGNYIKVKHDDGTIALYAHLKKGSSFNQGTKVSVGQTIARIGNTGNSTGPHLHAEYRNTANVNEPVNFYINPQEEMTLISEAKLTQIREDRDKNWNLYQKQLTENEELKRQIEITKKDFEDRLQVIKNQLEVIEAQVVEKDKEIADLKKELIECKENIPSTPPPEVPTEPPPTNSPPDQPKHIPWYTLLWRFLFPKS